MEDWGLEQLLNQIESDRVERKESWKGDAPEKARQAICTWRWPPKSQITGRLNHRTKDDGQPSGAIIDDRLLQTLGEDETDGQILPPPSIFVEKRVLGGTKWRWFMCNQPTRRQGNSEEESGFGWAHAVASPRHRTSEF